MSTPTKTNLMPRRPSACAASHVLASTIVFALQMGTTGLPSSPAPSLLTAPRSGRLAHPARILHNNLTPLFLCWSTAHAQRRCPRRAPLQLSAGQTSLRCATHLSVKLMRLRTAMMTSLLSAANGSVAGCTRLLLPCVMLWSADG